MGCIALAILVLAVVASGGLIVVAVVTIGGILFIGGCFITLIAWIIDDFFTSIFGSKKRR